MKIQRLTAEFDQIELRHLNQSNLSILEAVISLELPIPDQIDPEQVIISKELARIEQKVDFMMHLFSKVIVDSHPLPDKMAITLSATEIGWNDLESYSAGDKLKLSVYLSHKFPLPLELTVSVLNSICHENDNTIQAEIIGMEDSTNDLLTRLIFLHHRREIARNKTQLSMQQ